MSTTAITKAPSTPTAQTAPAPSLSGTPGTWRHPRLDEITRRQKARTFGDSNIRTIAYNAFIIVATFVLPALTGRFAPWINHLLRPIQPYRFWPLLALRLFLVVNIAISLRPLYAVPDDLSDIPLTPSQRLLLGLPPASAPLPPDTVIHTPPRYSRSPSVTSSGRATRGDASPLGRSTSGSPWSAQDSLRRDSTWSPSGSPLVRKAMDGRRSSMGRDSPLSFSLSSAGGFSDSLLEGLDVRGGLSPKGISTGRDSGVSGKSSVGVGAKWLYERGSRSGLGSFS